jgi:hypothetical protein
VAKGEEAFEKASVNCEERNWLANPKPGVLAENKLKIVNRK